VPCPQLGPPPEYQLPEVLNDLSGNKLRVGHLAVAQSPLIIRIAHYTPGYEVLTAEESCLRLNAPRLSKFDVGFRHIYLLRPWSVNEFAIFGGCGVVFRSALFRLGRYIAAVNLYQHLPNRDGVTLLDSNFLNDATNRRANI
jgi:hypothetical protein